MRTRVVGKAVIAQGGKGPIRWALEAHGAALALFRARERNDMIREALEDGGKFYAAVFVPMNFTQYAERKGYDVSFKFFSQKLNLAQRGVIDSPVNPLVYTGVLRDAAVNRTTVSAIATANKAAILIRIPIPSHGNAKTGGYGIAPIVGLVLRTIMPWEITRVAEVVEQSLVRGLQGRMEQRFKTPSVPTPRELLKGPRRARAAQGPRRQAA